MAQGSKPPPLFQTKTGKALGAFNPAIIAHPNPQGKIAMGVTQDMSPHDLFFDQKLRERICLAVRKQDFWGEMLRQKLTKKGITRTGSHHFGNGQLVVIFHIKPSKTFPCF